MPSSGRLTESELDATWPPPTDGSEAITLLDGTSPDTGRGDPAFAAWLAADSPWILSMSPPLTEDERVDIGESGVYERLWSLVIEPALADVLASTNAPYAPLWLVYHYYAERGGFDFEWIQGHHASDALAGVSEYLDDHRHPWPPRISPD